MTTTPAYRSKPRRASSPPAQPRLHVLPEPTAPARPLQTRCRTTRLRAVLAAKLRRVRRAVAAEAVQPRFAAEPVIAPLLFVGAFLIFALLYFTR